MSDCFPALLEMRQSNQCGAPSICGVVVFVVGSGEDSGAEVTVVTSVRSRFHGAVSFRDEGFVACYLWNLGSTDCQKRSLRSLLGAGPRGSKEPFFPRMSRRKRLSPVPSAAPEVDAPSSSLLPTPVSSLHAFVLAVETG